MAPLLTLGYVKSMGILVLYGLAIAPHLMRSVILRYKAPELPETLRDTATSILCPRPAPTRAERPRQLQSSRGAEAVLSVGQLSMETQYYRGLHSGETEAIRGLPDCSTDAAERVALMLAANDLLYFSGQTQAVGQHSEETEAVVSVGRQQEHSGKTEAVVSVGRQQEHSGKTEAVVSDDSPLEGTPHAAAAPAQTRAKRPRQQEHSGEAQDVLSVGQIGQHSGEAQAVDSDDSPPEGTPHAAAARALMTFDEYDMEGTTNLLRLMKKARKMEKMERKEERIARKMERKQKE